MRRTLMIAATLLWATSAAAEDNLDLDRFYYHPKGKSTIIRLSAGYGTAGQERGDGWVTGTGWGLDSLVSQRLLPGLRVQVDAQYRDLSLPGGEVRDARGTVRLILELSR